MKKYIYVVENKYNPLEYFSTRELAKEFIEENGDICAMWITKQEIDAPVKRMRLC